MNDKVSRHPHRNLLDIDSLQARRVFFYLWQIVTKGKIIILIPIANGIAGGLLLSLFDGKSLLEGQYLAVVTALTVGYGDLAPESWPARFAAAFIGFNGILFTGIVLAFVIKAVELAHRDELEEIEKKKPEEE